MKLEFENGQLEFENKDTTSDFQPYDYTKETQEESFETTYTENELKEALAQAEEVAYNKGKEDASNALIERQNILLENIKHQLTLLMILLMLMLSLVIKLRVVNGIRY